MSNKYRKSVFAYYSAFALFLSLFAVFIFLPRIFYLRSCDSSKNYDFYRGPEGKIQFSELFQERETPLVFPSKKWGDGVYYARTNKDSSLNVSNNYYAHYNISEPSSTPIVEYNMAISEELAQILENTQWEAEQYPKHLWSLSSYVDKQLMNKQAQFTIRIEVNQLNRYAKSSHLYSLDIFNNNTKLLDKIRRYKPIPVPTMYFGENNEFEKNDREKNSNVEDKTKQINITAENKTKLVILDNITIMAYSPDKIRLIAYYRSKAVEQHPVLVFLSTEPELYQELLDWLLTLENPN